MFNFFMETIKLNLFMEDIKFKFLWKKLNSTFNMQSKKLLIVYYFFKKLFTINKIPVSQYLIHFFCGKYKKN